MFFKEDNSYNDIREKSLMSWLDEMEQHEDVAVRGGVRLTRDYILYLKKRIETLEDQGKMRDEYLKKLATKSKQK